MPSISTAQIIVQIIAVAMLFLLTAWRRTPFLQILSCGVAALIGYGMIQDAITAHLSLEYFVIAHPRIFRSDVPILHGLMWGFLGGWPGGLCLGIALACTSTLGPWPRLPMRQILMSLGVMVVGLGIVVALSGMVMWINYERLALGMLSDWADRIPPANRRGFVTVATINLTTYLGAITGTLLLCGWVSVKRRTARA